MKRRIESDEDSSEDESRFQEAAITPDAILETSKIHQSIAKSKSFWIKTMMESWILSLI